MENRTLLKFIKAFSLCFMCFFLSAQTLPEKTSDSGKNFNESDKKSLADTIKQTNSVSEKEETAAPSKNEELEKKIANLDLDMDLPDDILSHPLIKKFIEQYSNNYGKKYLNSVMKNSFPYRGYVQLKLSENEMPLCLQYLPVIESGYRINALSKSGAHGLWQFMKNSVSPFGIRVNSWMDERVDPWLSTDAAIKKLKENYDYFNNWELALAAYNCGLGAVNRAVKASGVKDFWYLCENGYLKSETKHYVPKFIAVSYMLENREEFGLEFEDPVPGDDLSCRFDELTVKKAIDLKILSEKTEISYDVLVYYNPSLNYNITPPDMKYVLRLPEGTKDEVEEMLESSISLINYHMYTVQSGDSLYALALHYGVEVEDIQRANNLRNTTIKIGQKLMIPALNDVGEYKRKIENEQLDFSGTYTVNEKDTLYGIALQYNIQLELLASENNMEITDVLHKGDVIKVPIIKQEEVQQELPKVSNVKEKKKKK